MSWLAFSLIASVVLTIALNVVLRLFPRANERFGEGLDRLAARTADDRQSDDPDPTRVRVIFPWKAMLIASLLLTVAINVVLLAFR